MRRMRNSRSDAGRGLGRADRGAALVEFAIVAPVLFFIIIGGLDLGLEMLFESRLLFVTQQAAVAEAKTPGSGVAWASGQMSGPVYNVLSPGCIAASSTRPSCYRRRR